MITGFGLQRSRIWYIAVFLLLQLSGPARAGLSDLKQPERFGLGMTCGHSYDPSPTFGFGQLTVIAQYDYDRIWPHRAPEQLSFKLEGSLGLASINSDQRLLASVNMLAHYYSGLAGQHLRPYLEAGIGLIYSDFQVEGQGLRVNFNPQAGVGCDFRIGNTDLYFTNLRIHHLSNGDLHHDNRGVNSVTMQFGRYF